MYKTKVKDMLQDNFEDILNYKNQGILNEDIGKLYGVSKSAITRIMQANGIFSRNLMNKDETIPLIIADYENGLTIHEIAKRYHTSQTTVSSILKDNHITIRPTYKTIYTINENFFDEINTEEKAYILGFLLSDGCISNHNINITLQENDREILEKINCCIDSNRPLHLIDNIKRGISKRNCFALNITNKHMVESLKGIGVTQNKSLNVTFPNVISDELLPHFLRGLWDGDGFIEKKRYRTGCTGTKMLLFEIKKKMKDILNINFIPHEESCKNGITYTIKVSNQRECISFLNYIYQDATIYLQRKYDTYQTYINKSLSA